MADALCMSSSDALQESLILDLAKQSKELDAQKVTPTETRSLHAASAALLTLCNNVSDTEILGICSDAMSR